MFAFIADEFLCVLSCRVVIVSLAEVLFLGISNGTAGSDRGQLILADATRQNLVFAGRCVEVPLTEGFCPSGIGKG